MANLTTLIFPRVDEEFDIFMPHPQAGTSGFKPTAKYLIANNMIRIYVGALEERRAWTLEEDLFFAASNFLKVTFQRVNHASSKLLLLENDDPVAFGLFIDWVYTGSLDLESENLLLPISLFILSEKLNTPQLSTEVLRKMEEQLNKAFQSPNLEQVVYLYENTTVGSPLRNLVVQHFVQKVFSMSTRKFAQEAPSWNLALSWDEFRCDVMIDFKRHCSLPSIQTCVIDRCSVHRRKIIRARPAKRKVFEEEDKMDEVVAARVKQEPEDFEVKNLVFRDK